MAALLIGITACEHRAARPEAEPTQRLITIGGPVTEIVFTLGLGDRIVATDTSSTYPAETKALPKVGYQRQLSAEGVLSLRPTAVLLSEEAGPPAALALLRDSGVPVFVAVGSSGADGARARIRTVAKVLKVPERGEALVRTMDQELLRAQAAPDAGKVSVLFLYARGAGTAMVGGRGTQVDEMLRLAGARNAAQVEGYKPLTPEGVVTAAPSIFLLTSRGFDSLGGAAGLLALPGYAQTPAGRDRRIVVLDDQLLLGFGPRLGQAVAELRARLRAAGSPSP
jgi:iron complex transport system substrate-binding protein